MDFDDMKWFILIGVVPLAIWAFVSYKDTSNAPAYDFDANVPVTTFVPEGTPGAMSWDEYREGGYWRSQP